LIDNKAPRFNEVCTIIDQAHEQTLRDDNKVDISQKLGEGTYYRYIKMMNVSSHKPQLGRDYRVIAEGDIRNAVTFATVLNVCLNADGISDGGKVDPMLVMNIDLTSVR